MTAIKIQAPIRIAVLIGLSLLMAAPTAHVYAASSSRSKRRGDVKKDRGKRSPSSKKSALSVGQVGRIWPFAPVSAKRSTALGKGGVGMVLDGKSDRVVISRVVPGGPAAQAGVQSGDTIVKVDGWTVPANPKSSDVAARIRGNIGTHCTLLLNRVGAQATTTAVITRSSMKSLFPKPAKRVLRIEQGTALLAVSDQRTLGVLFPSQAHKGHLIAYMWALAPRGEALSSPRAQRGHGVVAWGRHGATIQIAGWRLDLSPVPDDDGMIIHRSSLPVGVVSEDTWLGKDPAKLTYIQPRNMPQKVRKSWRSGSCHVHLKATSAGEPLAGRRISLQLRNRHGVNLPSASTQTDAHGRTSFQLPSGLYTVTGLATNVAGAGRDLYFSHRLEHADIKIDCVASTAPAKLTLALIAGPTSKVSIGVDTLGKTATQHKLVGQSPALMRVRKWIGGEPTALKRRGRVMFLYLWATWCGPCKRMSPVVAELDARLRRHGLLTISGSVDRNETMLDDYASNRLPGAMPIAWLGPKAMDTLEASGIPTLLAVDHKGIVRWVHTGTGLTLSGLESALKKMLDKARRAAQKPPVKRKRKRRR